jgi:hypothetical protein
MSPLGPLLLATFLFCVGRLRRHRPAQRRAGADERRADAQRREHQPRRLPEPAVPGRRAVSGQMFALFIIGVAAAEVGVGLAIVFNMFRNRATVDVDDVDLMRW